MAFRMWVPSSGRWLCLVLLLWHADGTMRFDCDDGKLLVERDLLPQKQISCPGPPWTESSQKLSSINTKYLSQPAQTVCMTVPIVYNQTIPNSGAHRPLGAESGEYLFCPPQRWLQNLQHGAIAFLYHPCAPVSQQAGLSALARSCLSHYIVTPFPQLSRLRPLALVAWGRTLELSHVTASEACDWLGRNALGSFQSAEQHRGGRYSLLLTRAADSQGLKDPVLGQAAQKPSSLGRQSLRQCCEGVLSAFSEPEPDMRRRRRRRREVRDPTMGPQVEGTRGGSQVPGLPNSSGVPRHDTHGTEAPKATVAGQETDSRKGGPNTVNTEEELKPRASVEGERRGSLKANRKQSVKTKHRVGKHWERGAGAGAAEDGHNVSLAQKTDAGAELKTGLVGEEAGKRSQSKAWDCVVPGRCGHAEAGAVPGQRLPTPRTDEAVWAAAALGFLLVLLALSVLHTRLYRNWRSPPSLYWHDPTQDYDCVADVIRRRLKLLGRRKRRSTQCRRQECVLLPNASSSEESD